MNKRKLENILKVLQERDLDLLILIDRANSEYLLEIPFETPSCIITLWKDGDYLVYVSKLEYWRVVDECNIEHDKLKVYARPGTGRTLHQEVNVRELIDDILKVKPVKKVGVDTSSNGLAEKLRKRNVEIVNVRDDILNVRSVKLPEEVEYIKRAVKIVEHCLEQILHLIKPGMREIDIEALILKCMVEQEGDTAFKPIVASGPNTVYPHHTSSRRKIQDGDVVIIDVGARYRCYCSDITRTILLTRRREIIEKLEALVHVQESVIKNIKAGVKAEELDKLARELLREYKLEEHFIHSLGHGLGVECHEKPSLAPSEDRPLADGNVVTIEPGVYIREERFGLRVEDDVLVTDRGYEMLSRFPKLLY